MRPPVDVWQGCWGNWQSAFIREHLLPLGHAAWQGYLTRGQGIVVCDIEIAETESVDWNRDIVEYAVRFIPLADVSAYLQTLNLEATLIERLSDTVQTYDPARQILLLINENGRAEVNLLQQLVICPQDCYQQMQRRWAEFQLESPK